MNNRKKFNELYKGLFNKEKSSSVVLNPIDPNRGDYKKTTINELAINDKGASKIMKPLFAYNKDQRDDMTKINHEKEREKLPAKEYIPDSTFSRRDASSLIKSRNNSPLQYNKESLVKPNQVTKTYTINISDINLTKHVKPKEYFKQKRESVVDYFTNFNNTVECKDFFKKDILDNIMN